MDDIVVGIDVGTSKICALVAKIRDEETLHIIGYGIQAARGFKKGGIIDLESASDSIARAVVEAEEMSNVKINSALVSLAGAHVSSVNSRGRIDIHGPRISENDIERVLDEARRVAVPKGREVIHVIQRGFSVDGEDGVQRPVGMHGTQLEVETHVITASSSAVGNLRTAIGSANMNVAQFVLNPLASAEVVLTEPERNMGAVVCDIGAGTTDLAIYVNGDVWHTMVLPFGGNNITQDIAHGLSLNFEAAEELKIKHGHAMEAEIGYDETIVVNSFGNERPVRVNRRDLAMIIEARVEEILDMALAEIKRSGYDGLLPAGMILTGGTARLSGIKKLADRVMRMPVRIGFPEPVEGMSEAMRSPAFSTGIGLINWAAALQGLSLPSSDTVGKSRPPKIQTDQNNKQLDQFKDFLKRLMP